MDYSGIINLAIVAVLFSTIIVPNLKKIGEIRDEVASVDFPLVNTTDEDSSSDHDQAVKGIELA